MQSINLESWVACNTSTLLQRWYDKRGLDMNHSHIQTNTVPQKKNDNNKN